MRTYAELLDSLAEHADDACQDFASRDGTLSRCAGVVLEAAQARARQLQGLGLVPGDRVALMITAPEDFLPLMHGCLMSGLVAVPMYPPPLFGRREPHRATTETVLRRSGARALIVDDGLPEKLGTLEVEQLTELSQLDGIEGTLPTRPPAPEDLAFLQFTSGSTGEPRGVRITHDALMKNARSIMVDGLNADASDRGVTWLPLYHDMGLVGFGLAPLLTRTKVTFLPTARFIRNPAVWLRTIDATRATITFAPNFAYELVTRRVPAADLDLSSVRMWGCGAEPVSPTVLRDFETHFAACGVTSGQVSPCYGLAEATLAVTFTAPSAGRVAEHIDSDCWEERRHALPADSCRTLGFVSCGKALQGFSIEIVDASGKPLPERQAGEIVIRGPSIADGYFQAPEASQQSFRGGALYSGDEGYLADGHLFVTGRLKDTVIVSGRNYSPQVIEQSAMAVDGVRLAAAVNARGEKGDELVVIVERLTQTATDIAEQVRSRIAADVGVQVVRVVEVPPGALPRTTSGKLKRGAARALALVDSEEERPR